MRYERPINPIEIFQGQDITGLFNANPFNLLSAATAIALYGPIHTYPFLYENGYFFSDFAYHPHLFGKTVTENASFQKRSPE